MAVLVFPSAVGSRVTRWMRVVASMTAVRSCARALRRDPPGGFIVVSLSVRTQVLSFHSDLACCSPWRSWSLVLRDIVRNRPVGHQYHHLSFAQTCGKATMSLFEALDGVPEGALVPLTSQDLLVTVARASGSEAAR